MSKRTAAILLSLAASFLTWPAGADTTYCVGISGWNDSILTSPSVKYRVISKKDDFHLQNTPFQKLEARTVGKEGTVVCLVAGKAGASPAPGPEDLADTRFLNLKSPEIAGAAARLKGTKDPLLDVTRFVNAHITHKSVGIPLIPARSVYNGRSGDCTEHSVLAIALLRSLGVHCRAATGMLAMKSFMGHDRVFVFHMWVEAYHGGKWHIVDAANPTGPAHGRYVNLAYHSLKTAMPLPYLRAISAIEDLRAEVAE